MKTQDSTIDIFAQLCTFVSPVLPSDLDEQTKHALTQLQGDYDIESSAIEDTVIHYGKLVWPYRKAFAEFLAEEQTNIAEKFFISKCSAHLKKKFHSYVEEGGSFRALHSGKNLQNFTAEEKIELGKLLSIVHEHVKKHTLQKIHSTNEEAFQDRVAHFAEVLTMIEEKLATMREMAEMEQEHPQIADEIRDSVHHFELGLSAIGPEISFDDLKNSHEHFRGRKHDLKKIKV